MESRKNVALCKACDKEEYVLIDYGDEVPQNQNHVDDASDEKMNKGNSVANDCASRGFHVFRKYWRPKLTDKLTVLIEKSNVCDPYARGIYVEIRGKISGKCLVGHIPREISRFCKFFLDYGGQIHATVTSSKFRRSPLPQGGLSSMRADTSDEVFLKWRSC